MACEARSNRQLFALKTLRGTLPQSQKIIRRLLHEARATDAVKSRHVVQMLDVEADYVHAASRLPYIVMELLEGENLSEFLERVRTIPAAQVVWLTWQLIYTRLKAIGQLERLAQTYPAKDWSTAWHAGARKIVREEHRV